MDFYGLPVGDTPLYQVVELSAAFAGPWRGRPAVYVKDESYNATGTFKARAAVSQLMKFDHVEEPVSFVGHTYGNFGKACGLFCSDYESKTGKKRQFVSVVPSKLDRRTKRMLGKYGPVIEHDSSEYLSSARLVQLAQDELGESAGLIVPVDGIDLRPDGYRGISLELLKSGIGNESTIFVPVGEGDLMANMIECYRELGEMPRFVGATVDQNVFAGASEGSSPADKLVTRYSRFEQYLKDLCIESGHKILTVRNEEIEREMGELQHLGIRAGPNAAVAFAVARKYAHEHGFRDGEEVVIINTGYDNTQTSSRLENYARRATAALLVGTLPLVGSGVNESSRMARIHEETRKWHVEYAKSELQNTRELNDIYAYALSHGNMERIDQKVLFNLQSYYIYSDMIARDMYNKNLNNMQDDVDGFVNWRRQQENARKARFERFTKPP